MATLKTVNGVATDAAGQPMPGATVIIALSQPTTIAGQGEVLSRPIILAANPTTGAYSVQLYSNADMSPAGTSYTMEYVSSDGYKSPLLYIIVPQGAGPFLVANIQTNVPPGNLATGRVASLTVDGTANFTAGPVIMGTDPGGTQLLRVGGTAHVSGLATLDGGLAVTAGAVTFPANSISPSAINGGVAVDSTVVHLAGAESITGVKTFSANPVFNAGGIALSAVSGAAADSAVIHIAGAETITGAKTFSANPIFNAGGIPLAAVAGAAQDSAVVHLAGAETITGAKTFSAGLTVTAGAVTLPAGSVADAALSANVALLNNAQTFSGVKTFSANPVFNAAAIPESAVANLTGDLAARALDSAVVHLAGAETISGAKTFSAGVTVSAGGAAITGAVTGGTYNGQTISAAANLTGSLTVANGLTVSAGGATISGSTTVTSAAANPLLVNATGVSFAGVGIGLQSNGVTTHQFNVWQGTLTGEATFTNVIPGTITIGAALGAQRFNLFGQPTITSSTAQAVTNAATLAVAGAPIAAGSATITNPYALWVQSGKSQFDGTISAFAGINMGGSLNGIALNLGALNITASAGTAWGQLFNATLNAAANNDALAAYAYNSGTVGTGTGLTGLTYYGLNLNLAAITKTGTGTIANAYGAYITAPTIGTNNYALYIPSGVTALGTGDPFLAYPATSPIPYGSLLTAQSGTGAAPDTSDGPVVHIARRISLTSGTEVGDGNYASAALSVDIGGNATNVVQPIAVRGAAKTLSTAASVGSLAADAAGGYFVGYASGASTHLGIGLFALGRSDSTAAGAGGRISGIQVGVENITATDATVLPGAFSGGAIWITAANSKSKVGTAIEIGNSGGGNTPGVKGGLFDVGIHFNSQVANGNTGAIDTAAIQDDSRGAYSYLINGTHASAAIAVASGSGPVLIGATARNQPSALFEVATGATTADPLVNFYGTTGAFSVRFANNSGSGKLAVSAGLGNFLAGSAAGDLIMQSSSTGNRVLLGGTSIVMSATFANTLGFFGATEVAQQNTTGTVTGFTAGVGTAVQDASTFTGGVGATAYRINDIVRALKNYGLLAA